MSFRILLKFIASVIIIGPLTAHAMPKNTQQMLVTPRYESCISLACLSQSQHLSAKITETDFLGIKARFAPRKAISKLLSSKLTKPKELLNESSSKESLEGIAADMFYVKAFKNNDRIENKVVVLKKIRGEENISRFLGSVNQMSLRLANLDDESIVGPRKVDSEGERLDRKISRLNVNLNTFLVSFMSGLNLASYIYGSIKTGHPEQWVLPLIGWELQNLAIYGTHAGFIFFKSLTNDPVSWANFLKGVEERQKTGSETAQFLYYALQSQSVRSLIGVVQEAGEDSAKLEKAMNLQTNEDHFFLPVGLMRLFKPEMSHLRAQFLFQKESTGEQSLTVTVTAQKKPPRPSPPPPQEDKTGEYDFGKGLVPGAG